MKPIELGSIGILQIGESRYGFSPTQLDCEWGSDPVLSGTFYPEMFAASNLKARAVERLKSAVPQIKRVVFNNPATVVIWDDGSKTVVKCQPGDTYSKETGLALCIAKKYLGNKGNFNEVFKKWIPEEAEPVKEISVEEMRGLLGRYCDRNLMCDSCLINRAIPSHKCGRGSSFLTQRLDGSYSISDDEIRAAYKVISEEV